MSATCLPDRIVLTIDYRERELITALADVPHCVKPLPAGDIICDYGGRSQWIAERKRADDLAKSIVSGRWLEQKGRLRETGQNIFFIIEGDLRSTSLKHDSMLGACINAELHKEFHVIRTIDLAETASVVRHLFAKGGSVPGTSPGTITSPAVSKRARDGELRTCWVRQLMCVPSISERIAVRLLDEYGSMPAIQHALRDSKLFKRIRLDDRTCLGEARIKKLAFYLISSGDNEMGDAAGRTTKTRSVCDKAVERGSEDEGVVTPSVENA